MFFNRFRILAAYVFAVPLALILGFLVASPDELTFMLIGLLLFFFALPLFIKWHHALLIVFWNSTFAAFFLPGKPDFWLFFAALSFGLSALNRVMGRKPFLPVPEMTPPVLFLAGVVVITGWYRGGIGTRVLGGSANGGKHYIYLMGAIMGYFALTAGQIPILKSRRMTSLFFLSGTTSVLSNLAYMLGPAFYFLYYLVPSGLAMSQAASDYGLAGSDRIEGLAPACIAALCFLLAYYGIRGLFKATKPWRFVFLCVIAGAGFFAGFRSIIALLFLIFAFQFCFEGLLRTRLFPTMVGFAMVGFVSLLLFANRMPLSVQRAVSFLPVNVDAAIRADALGSTDWRVQMWEVAWKDVPKYLIMGKGYAINPTDLYNTDDASKIGITVSPFEVALIAGDYHSGPLSLIIPFGIGGVIGFLWVLIGGFRVLYSNYRYGDARLRLINSVLLSYFLAYAFSFFFIFGSFDTQLAIFLGAVGLSVSLNSGVKRQPKLEPERARSSAPQAYAIELG